MDRLVEVQERILYLARPVQEISRLYRNASGRYERNQEPLWGECGRFAERVNGSPEGDGIAGGKIFNYKMIYFYN